MHPEVVKDSPGACDVCGMDLVRAEDLGVAGDPAPYVQPLVIPKTAVLVTGTRAVVYVLVPDTEKPTFEGREIVLGPRAGDLYIVRAGLSEGDEVVTNGVFKIDSAMQIAAKPSMMMPTTRSAAASVRDAVPEHFVAGLDFVYEAYLAAQRALASDDLDGFIVATVDMDRAIDLVDTGGLASEPLGKWRQAASRLTVDRPRIDGQSWRGACSNGCPTRRSTSRNGSATPGRRPGTWPSARWPSTTRERSGSSATRSSTTPTSVRPCRCAGQSAPHCRRWSQGVDHD